VQPTVAPHRARLRAQVGPSSREADVVNLVPPSILAALIVLVAPLWPWSRGWTWIPAGVLGMGLATMLLFTWAVEPL
jgi:hypothetical protein